MRETIRYCVIYLNLIKKYIELLKVNLYEVASIKAKKDERLRNSGNIIGFEFEGNFWDNEPKTAFYDYMYISTLYRNHIDIVDELMEYEVFSDIEFNPKRSINCQARTCAILVSLVKLELIDDALKSPESFREIVYEKVYVQGNLF